MVFNILLHLSFLNPYPSSDYISPVFIIFIFTGGEYKSLVDSTRRPKVNYKLDLDFERIIEQFNWNTFTGPAFFNIY